MRSSGALELQFRLDAQRGQYPQHQIGRDVLRIAVQDSGYTSARRVSKPRHAAKGICYYDVNEMSDRVDHRIPRQISIRRGQLGTVVG